MSSQVTTELISCTISESIVLQSKCSILPPLLQQHVPCGSGMFQVGLCPLHWLLPLPRTSSSRYLQGLLLLMEIFNYYLFRKTYFDLTFRTITIYPKHIAPLELLCFYFLTTQLCFKIILFYILYLFTFKFIC